MKSIPMVQIPENFHIAVVSYDSTYDDGGIENLLINQAGFPHANIIDLYDLPRNPEKKFDLVIYVHRSKKSRKIYEFLEVFNQFKEKFAGVPSLKINIIERINKRILKVRNISRGSKIQNIVEAVTSHLEKMYNISFQR